MQIRPSHITPPQTRSNHPSALDKAEPLDTFQPSQPTLELLSPTTLRKSEVRRAVDRMVRGEVSQTHRETLSRSLEPYGEKILNRLADNGLTLVVPDQGYAHYSTTKKQITFPTKDLDRDTEPVPFRDYMVLHEMAHALDFLLDPENGPLSERADLGIDSHRTNLNKTYQPVLQRFEQIKQRRQREGTWGSRPGGPTARVYGEDFMTVVEKVTGETLAERPARGHLTILEPRTRPTEYFADAVYTYLHSEPVTVHHYTLPDGQPIAHSYPPTRAKLEQRDPKMYEAVHRFFNDPRHRAQSIAVN